MHCILYAKICRSNSLLNEAKKMAITKTKLMETTTNERVKMTKTTEMQKKRRKNHRKCTYRHIWNWMCSRQIQKNALKKYENKRGLMMWNVCISVWRTIRSERFLFSSFWEVNDLCSTVQRRIQNVLLAEFLFIFVRFVQFGFCFSRAQSAWPYKHHQAPKNNNKIQQNIDDEDGKRRGRKWTKCDRKYLDKKTTAATK